MQAEASIKDGSCIFKYARSDFESLDLNLGLRKKSASSTKRASCFLCGFNLNVSLEIIVYTFGTFHFSHSRFQFSKRPLGATIRTSENLFCFIYSHIVRDFPVPVA